MDQLYKVVKTSVIFVFIIITVRLFYWQVLSGKAFQSMGLLQYKAERRIDPLRGEILSADNYPLASNKKSYTVYAYKPSLELNHTVLSQKIAPLLISADAATLSADLIQTEIKDIETRLQTILSQQNQWVALEKNINDEQKSRFEQLNLEGIGFDETYSRFYPEASLSAHLLGFVGSDKEGYSTGYFGLEGYYDRELTGKPGFIKGETDVFGRPILYGDFQQVKKTDGRILKTHLDRGLQLLVENNLKAGMSRYKALAGEVTIMDPKSGAILALASFPNYEPENFPQYPGEFYRIPSIAETYEPGSTFKTIVMAGAINEGLISPETACDSTCDGPITIGKYTIRTWNNQYLPGITMREVLERSDNTGMVYVARLLGKEKFIANLAAFGIGEKTGIDLESESVVPLKSNWGDIDIATAAFGQGIAVNSIQMLTAVAAIANGGKLMEPQVVGEIIDQDGKQTTIYPKVIRQVISPESAATMTDLMVASAKHGEAQWAIPSGYQIAGKTGTAQVPIAGHYDSEKTIASFVGFAPASDPLFIMLVKLREPQTSPWASETAAPLWVKIAKDIFIYYNIPPS